MPVIDYSRVARLYDIYVKTDFDVPFFLEFTQRCGSVLELMCGTGRLSLPLLKAGVPLTCVDNSPDMLALFREKLSSQELSAEVHEMDVCALDLQKRFDRIIIPFHAFAEIIEPENQHRALASICSHLTDDGIFVCTLHNPAVRLRTVDGQVHAYGEYTLLGGGALFLSGMARYEESTRLVTGVQFYEEYNPKGVLERKSYLDTLFYLHDKAGFSALATSHGFEVDALYGDYDSDAYQEQESSFMIWVLKKSTEPLAAGEAEKPLI